MKRNLLAFCMIGLLALVIAGCNQAPQPSDNHDADIQALKQNEAQWNLDYQAKDLDKLLAHYTDDAVLMTPGAPPTNGKQGIRTALGELVGDSNLSLKFEASRVEVAKSGDMAYTQGVYTLTVTDPGTKKPVNDAGSYVTIYKKQADGSWKAVSDIASSATPPGPPPPAAK